MRRGRIGALMMTLLLLTACGGSKGPSGEEQALRIRTDYLSMTGCTGHMDLTADYGERVFSCGLDLVWDRVEGGLLTVTDPAPAAGLTARFSGDSLTLSYDGASLETGPLTDRGLSPLEAPATFYRALTQGDLAVCDLSEGVLSLTVRDYDVPPGEGLEVLLTLAADTGAPLTGAIYWNGAEVLSARMRDFTILTTAAD